MCATDKQAFSRWLVGRSTASSRPLQPAAPSPEALRSLHLYQDLPRCSCLSLVTHKVSMKSQTVADALPTTVSLKGKHSII